MAAFNIQEALIWKEKIESIIDQHQESLVSTGNKYVTFEYKSGIDNGQKSSHRIMKVMPVLSLMEETSMIESWKGACLSKYVGHGSHTHVRGSSVRHGLSAPEDEEDSDPTMLRRTTIGNVPPESVFDWTTELDPDLSNQNTNNRAFSRKHWRLLQCQNGLRIFEELLEVDFLPKSCSRAMKAVGVVEGSCEEIFELVMSMDAIRFE
ncbi:similar to ENHANCED DISEASE RESISTANCE 2 [Actinidia rufa]|uniref:Similar to ENHANCED DISEASE RESISTANCE 2 n=1 Tax=Actinidia rufa TaxID=165716 RepID=A0A7J0GZX6_9ERIC|nr:similar to ENHANCED DISEASE RESISTANCE 2 [Actinidia rufa]